MLRCLLYSLYRILTSIIGPVIPSAAAMEAPCPRVPNSQYTPVCSKGMERRLKNQKMGSVKHFLDVRSVCFKVSLTIKPLFQEGNDSGSVVENPKIILKKETIWTGVDERTEKILGEKLNLDYTVCCDCFDAVTNNSRGSLHINYL